MAANRKPAAKADPDSTETTEAPAKKAPAAKKTAAAKKASPVAEVAAPADAATPETTDAVTSEAGEPAGDATEESVPLNRAERRAKGKGGSQNQPTTRGKVVGGKGPAHTHRMWANRRSG